MSKEPNIIVDEIEVIIAVSEWLHKEGKNIDIISIPKGGKSKKEKKAIIEAELGKYGISPKYEANGPDIVASCEDPPEIWYVGCKGSGTGGSSTHRNNFDQCHICRKWQQWRGRRCDYRKQKTVVNFQRRRQHRRS